MITDPLKFYTRLCGNVEEAYETEAILPTMKVEFISALGPALAKLSNLELRPNQIPAHSEELEQHLNEDGSVTIPEALRPYMGGKEKLQPEN
jgi:hypothetical protein